MEDIYHHLLVDLLHKSMPHHWQVVQLWGAWLQYLLDPGRWLQHLLHRTWARLITPTYCSSCVRERVDPPITLDGLHRSSATGVTWMHPTHFIHLCWHIPLYIRLLRSFTLGRLSVSCKVADSVSSHVTKAYLSLKDPFFFLPPIQSSVWWDLCVGCSYHQPFRMHVIFTAVCSSSQLFECGCGRSSQTKNPYIGAVLTPRWDLWNFFGPCDIGLQPMDYFIGVPRDFVWIMRHLVDVCCSWWTKIVHRIECINLWQS